MAKNQTNFRSPDIACFKCTIRHFKQKEVFVQRHCVLKWVKYVASNWMYLKLPGMSWRVFSTYRNALPSPPLLPAPFSHLLPSPPLREPLLLAKMPRVWGTMSSRDSVTGLPFTVPYKMCRPQWAFGPLIDGLYVRAVTVKPRPRCLCGG